MRGGGGVRKRGGVRVGAGRLGWVGRREQASRALELPSPPRSAMGRATGTPPSRLPGTAPGTGFHTRSTRTRQRSSCLPDDPPLPATPTPVLIALDQVAVGQHLVPVPESVELRQKVLCLDALRDWTARGPVQSRAASGNRGPCHSQIRQNPPASALQALAPKPPTPRAGRSLPEESHWRR